MAGPGGGGRGGGFGGGSFSGGFSGGGAGFHGVNRGGAFFGRRTRYVGGGGCSTLVFLGIFILFAFMWFVGEPTEITLYEEENGYSESVMQDYADMRYREAFGDAEGYEDNILLVFLTNEACDGYYTIAWVGDNVRTEINEMFGEYSEYGNYLGQYINSEYYAYSLDTNLADVVSAMEKCIVLLDFDSSFRTQAAGIEGKKSELINYSSLELSEVYVNEALRSFTEKTGIPCAVVVDESEFVFGTAEESVSATPGDIVTNTDAEEEGYTSKTVEITPFKVVVAVVGIAAAVALIIALWKPVSSKKKASAKKEEKNDMPWES